MLRASPLPLSTLGEEEEEDDDDDDGLSFFPMALIFLNIVVVVPWLLLLSVGRGVVDSRLAVGS